MSTRKNLSIETLRGITILLVVVGHVIGSAPDGGMKIDFPHPLRYLYLWIDYIQMPLFTAIAGYVYALKPFSVVDKFSNFLRKKALRLLVPMAVIGTLYFLVQYFTPGTNNKGNLSEIWRIYIFPYTIYWYLPSLFLMFLIQAVIDRFGGMDTLRKGVCCCVIALLFTPLDHYPFMAALPNLLSFKGALGQLPYFFAGVMAWRFSGELHRIALLRIGEIASILLGLVLIQIVWLYPDSAASTARILYPLALIPTLFLFLRLKWHHRFFTWIGGYAYSIYLFHGFGTSGGRIALKAVGVKAVGIIFVAATIIATACPIVVDKVVRQFKWGRVLLLGER